MTEIPLFMMGKHFALVSAHNTVYIVWRTLTEKIPCTASIARARIWRHYLIQPELQISLFFAKSFIQPLQKLHGALGANALMYYCS